MKRALFCGVMAAVLAIFFAAAPASAEAVMRDSSCTAVNGSNSMTYDCNYHVSNYVVGTPLTFAMTYSCTGACGPVMSFGLRGKGFVPAGVSGHLVGGKRLPNGIELTFVFDSLKSMGNQKTGTAQFNMNVNMDDGSGSMSAVPCKVDVHLKQ
ncbi:MAG: hypothetical protein HY613_06260 [Candidatus Rokubacteria bacterium]|nr:hypothetical protein [Candidatus Rokubacteria bacterium]